MKENYIVNNNRKQIQNFNIKILKVTFYEILSILLGVLRIFGTAGIFFFHVFGLSGLNKPYLAFISILIFSFLSGFFGVKVHINPHYWIIKRFYSIMIPYWIVIIPAVIINRIIKYKNTTFLMDIITILGGNLFLDNPVYVIAWYITYVLILYWFLYIRCFFRLKLITWLLLFIVGYFLGLHYYILSFVIGFIVSKYIVRYKAVQFSTKIGYFIFKLQKYCYAFFLLHGGILIFLYYELHCSFYVTVVLGIILSSVLSKCLIQISLPLIVKMTEKTFNFILVFGSRCSSS